MLSESEEKFTKTFQFLPMAVALTTFGEGRFVNINEAFTTLYGYSREEVIGRTSREVALWVDPGDRNQVAGWVRAGRTVRDFETQVRARDGRLRWISFSCQVLEMNGSTMLLSAALDITERRAALEAMARTQARLLRAEDVARFGHWELDLDGGRFSGSAGASRIYGLPGTTWGLAEARRVPLPEYRAGLDAAMAALIGDGQPYQMEFRIRRPCDGAVRDIRSIAEFDREQRRVFGVIQDITERKRVEAALQESEFFFRESQRAAAIGSYRTDFRTGLWESSEVMDQVFGIAPDYPRSIEAWADLVHPEDREAMKAYLFDEVVGRRQPFAREYRIIRQRDRAVRWVNGLGAVTFDEEGSPLFLTGTIQDITERKLREQELQRKTEEMERFTYMVSHDLKSPLVTVRTFLDYLELDLAQGRAGRAVEDMAFIRDAAGRMGLLLDDLLEVSRVGRVVNLPTRFRVSELIRGAERSVAGALASRRVEVRVTGPDLLLEGDRPRLEELWQNLLENAVKYMGSQPRPRVELGVEQAGEATQFFVRDNGMGIDPRFISRIFGLFEKLDAASEGSGLGLALVKRIVDLYNGRVWVESGGPGKGSCFRFTLPDALIPTLQGATHER